MKNKVFQVEVRVDGWETGLIANKAKSVCLSKLKLELDRAWDFFYSFLKGMFQLGIELWFQKMKFAIWITLIPLYQKLINLADKLKIKVFM